MTFDCLYCAQNKPASESSLEHAVPQFLGGAQAPLRYKLHNVCRTCNNRLGLHVDGSYAKSWFVTNALAVAARKYYSGPGQNHPFPLVCMGPVNIPNLLLPKDTVAEYWLGPSGETIVWVRTDDDALYWYTGGNPTHRKHASTVYFMPVTGEPVRLQMSTEALIGAFKKAKARRIFGATIGGLPPGATYPGFDLPTATDDSNVQAIHAAIHSGSIHTQLRLNTKFDLRFICKMALAVGFSLFGHAYLATAEAAAAQSGLWPNPSTQPSIRGSQTFFNNPQLAQVAGYEGAVVILVIRTGGAYVMAMTIDRGLPFVVELCPDTLSSGCVDPTLGYSLVLFPQLQRCVELSMADLLAHVLGNASNAALTAIDQQRQTATAFWNSLPP
ncbi:MAG: hypothetical protein C3F19_03560 [Rhodocyclales bacterium]|nr:MAG: hypothetical protein C3F19_03560 [Rhodocyclales bacterium]